MRVEISDVSMRYKGGHQALDGVSLTMDKGLFGLLGPNGAGKTTLMKIVCTLLEPTGGRILIDGKDLSGDRHFVRERLGYLPQDWGAPRSARCREVLDLVLKLRGMSSSADRAAEIEKILTLVHLSSLAKRKVKTLSGGQLRRLGVAQALAASPDLIVLDEPTVGLDPNERVSFRNLLTELGRERTIILSTHIVADVGTTCERVGVIDRGTVAFEGPPNEFAERARERVFEAVVDPLREDEVRAAGTVVSTIPSAEGSIFRVVAERSSLPGGCDWQAVDPNLEDAYLAEVGEEALADDLPGDAFALGAGGGEA
jgi:ABC-type multidrug transport system ATPase subunit